MAHGSVEVKQVTEEESYPAALILVPTQLRSESPLVVIAAACEKV